ncbi:MAG TPA: hypothetical protein VGM82_10920 [Gemmatimonadaceae bacterium]
MGATGRYSSNRTITLFLWFNETLGISLQELQVVSPISSATSSVSAAYARYDRAASAVVSKIDPDNGDTGDIAGSVASMDQSQIQATASLLMMKKSNDMLASVLNLFDYGAPVQG